MKKTETEPEESAREKKISNREQERNILFTDWPHHRKRKNDENNLVMVISDYLELLWLCSFVKKVNYNYSLESISPVYVKMVLC